MFDLADCLIEPADVEHLKKELPNVKIIWKGLSAPGGDGKSYVRSTAQKWIPKDLIEKSIASGEESAAGDACEVTSPSLAQLHVHLSS